MATNNPPQVLSPSLPKAPDDIHLGLTRGDQYRGISQEMSEDQKDFKFPLRANSDNEERRAEDQSLWDAWANGITSRGLSIGTKLVQGGAVLLSAPYAIATASLDNLYDNAVVNAIASSDDWLRETFPVYGTKKRYHGQSLLSQLGTVKFWAEDAMDGVAFAISAYIGGAGAIAGLKGLAKVTKLTKVLKGTKAFKGLANMSSEAAVKNGIEVVASTAYNTITEAGFEANDVKKQLQEEYAIKKYNQPFGELSNIQQNEISNEVAEYAKNVFVGNTLVLAIPNLWQSNIFFGKNVGSGANKLFKSLQKGTISPKDLVKNKKVWKGVVKGATEGIVAEGIWEENIQTAMSNYEVRRMNRDLFNEEDTGDGRISGYINEWFKNFTTDEGLKSMFLGALIGAPMGAVSGGRKNAEANKDVTKAKLRYDGFINRLKNVDTRFEENVKSFYRVYEKDEEVDEVDEDGKPTGNKKNQRTKSYINPETGKPEVDLEKVLQLFYQTLNDKSLFDEAVTATMNNDPLHLEVVKQEAVARRVYSVLTDPDFDTIEEAVEYLKKQPDVDLSAFPGLDTEFKEQSEEVKKEIDYYAKILKEAQESLADIKDFQEDKEWGGFKRKLTKAHLLNMSALKALERKTNVVIEEVYAAREAIVAEHPDDYFKRKDYKDLDALRNLYYDLDMSKTFITNKAERERLFKEYKQEQNLLEELREKHETLKKKEDVNDDELLESEYSIEEAELLSGEFQRSNEKDEVLAQREKSNRILAVSEDERDRLAEFGMYNQFKYDAGKHIQTQQEFNKKWGEQEIPSDEDIEAAYELSTTAVDKNTLPEGEINPVELLSDEQKNTLSKYFPETNITDVSPEQAEELYNRLKAIKDEYDIDKIGLDNSKNENKIIDKILRGDRAGNSNLLNFLKRKIANKVFDKVREILNAFENNPEYAESEYIAKVIKQLLRLRKIFSTEIRKELLESAEFEGFIEDIDSAIAMLTEKLKLAIENQNNKSAKQIESFKNESEYRFEALGIDVEESTSEKIEDNKVFPGLLNFLMKIPTIKKIIIEAFSDTEHPKHKIYYERIVEIIKKDKILSQKIKDFLEAHKHSLIEQAGEAYGNFISHAKLKEQYKQLAKYAASNPINTLVALIRFNTSERKDDAPQDNAIDNFIRSRDLIKLRRDLKEGKPTGYYVTTEQLSALVEVFYQLQMANDLQSDINSEYDHNEEYKNEDEILLEEIARIAKLNKENPGGRIFEIVPTFQQMFAIRDIIRWYKRKFNSGKYFTGWIYQKGIAGSGKTAIVYKWAIKILKLKENQIFSVAHTKEATDNINSVHSSSNSSGVLSKNLEASHISDDVKLLVIDEVGALDNQELAKIAIIVHEINKKRADDNKLKVLALGDPNQINRSNFGIPVIDDWINIVTNTTTQENNNVLRELKNIESAFPLTVPYRSRVGILNTLADTFMDNFSKVSNLVLKANRAIGNRTVTGAHKGSVNEMVKQINAAKDNGRSKVIIVADINNVPKELKDTGLPIKDFVQVQGSTIDEAYIYIPRSAFAEMAEKNFNDAMYTAISRATEYVFLADTVGNMTWYEDSSVNESSAQFEKDMTDNFDNYTENLSYELGENPKNPPKDKPEKVAKTKDVTPASQQNSALRGSLLPDTEVTPTEEKKITKATGIKPKNLRDVYKAGREVFGLNKVQALAQAIIVNKVVNKIAKNRGVTAEKVWSEIEFRKGMVNRKDALYQQAKAALFYSPTEKALTKIQQNKGTAEQFKAMLLKNGAKQAELDWMGWDEFVKGKTTLTKAEIQEWIDGNKVEIEEVQKTDIEDKWEKKGDNYKYGDYIIRKTTDGNWFVFYQGKREGVYSSLDGAKNYVEANTKANTKYSQYQTLGGENYKELLLTMPNDVNQDRIIELADELETLGYITYVNNIIKEKDENGFGGKEVSINNLPEKAKEAAKELFALQTKKEKQPFKSSHFDEPNILAHVRFNERTDSEGNKVLFIEEIQSDWAQEGKKKGFKNPITDKEISVKFFPPEVPEGKDPSEYPGYWETYDNRTGEMITRRPGNYTESQVREEAKRAYKANFESIQVPNMPFKKTDQWVNLTIRRMIRYAAENGFDRIAWTNGEQQAERYDLSKQVNEVYYFDNSDGTYSLAVRRKNEGVIYNEANVKQNKLPDIVGKELADKIISGENKNTQKGGAFDNWNVFSGLDLKVGGEGMEAFYNSIVPNAAKELGKKFGAKVEPVTLNFGNDIDNETGEAIPDNEQQVLSIQVTQSMKQSALNEGMTLFQNQQGTGKTAKGAIQFLADGNAIISALTNPNVSTPLHEIAHLYERYMPDSERKAVLKWAKHKTWSTETSEMFARGFEKYLATGKAPLPSLDGVFRRFKAWLTDIYNGITGSEIDIQLNDAMTDIYSAMLGADVVQKTTKNKNKVEKPLTDKPYEALGFNNVPSEKISNELKDILTPKEDVYNRELYFSGVFETSDEYDNTVSKELEPFLLPLIKKYVKKLMIEADVHSSDIKNYNEKIDKANTIEDLPNIEYFNKWGITNAEKSWTTLHYDRRFIVDIIYSNIENLPLDILFKDDISKKNGKYYAKIKKFKTNEDTTGIYDNVSSWHKSNSYPSKYYDYTIRAKFKPQDVGFGKYTYNSGYDNDYYSEMYIPEYIINEEVEINIHDTFSRNKKRLNNEGKINVWFDTNENIEDVDNAIINDAYQKDSLFEETAKYFRLRKNIEAQNINTEAKKADIERRRQEELSKLQPTSENELINKIKRIFENNGKPLREDRGKDWIINRLVGESPLTNALSEKDAQEIKFAAYRLKEGKYDITDAEKKEINDKYDAELKALKAQPISETQQIEKTLTDKPGVSELFESNPELANIGTPEQYSQYLDTIFPDSKVKDIVYHGSNQKINQFEIKKEPLIHFGTKNAAKQRGSVLNQVLLNVKDLQTIKDGMWFLGTDEGGLLKELLDRNILTIEEVRSINEVKNKAIEQSRYFHEDYRMAIPEGTIAGAKKLQEILKDKNIGFKYTNLSEDKGSTSYAVPSQEQIHILGSKQDIEGFKEFVATKRTKEIEAEPEDKSKNPPEDEPEETQEINPEKSINAEPTEEELDDYVVSDTFDDTGEDEDNAGEIHPTPTIISDHQITPKYPSYDAVKRKDKKDTEPRVQIGDTVYGVVVKDSRTGINRVLIIGAIGKNKYRILAELDEAEILDLVSKGELNYTAYADANPIKGVQFVRNSIVNIGTNFTSDTGENTPLLFKGKLGEGSMPLTYHYGSELSQGENVLTKALSKLVRLFKNNLFNAVDYAVIIPVSAKALQKIFPSTTNNANNSLSLKEHVGEREITDELIEDLIANGQIVTDVNGKVVYNNETYDTLEKLKQDMHKKEFEGNLYKGTPYIIMRAISNKGKEVFQYIRLNPAKVSKDSKYYFFRGEGANRKLHSKSLMQPIQEFRDALKEITNFFVADGGSFLGDMSFNRTLQEFKHFFSIDPNTKEIIKNKAFTYEMYKANIEKGNKSQYKHLLPTYDILSEELFNKIANSTAIDKVIKGYYGVSQRDKAHTHEEFVELYGNLEPSGSDNNVFIDTFEGKKYAFAPQKNNPSVGAIIEYEYSNGKETSKGEIEKEDFLKGGLGPAQSSLDLIAKANKSIKGKQLRVTKKLGDGRITTKAPNLLDDIMISNSYNAILNKMIKESEVEAKQDWFKTYLEKEQWMIENKIATIEQLQEIKERDNIKWTKIDDEMLDAIVEYDSEGNNNSLRLPLDANVINTLGKDMHTNKKALSDMLGTNLEGISPTKIVIDLDNNEREENLQKKEVPKKDSKEIKESIKDVPKESLEQDVNSFVSKELTNEQQKALKKINDNNNINFKC